MPVIHNARYQQSSQTKYGCRHKVVYELLAPKRLPRVVRIFVARQVTALPVRNNQLCRMDANPVSSAVYRVE